MRLFKFFIVIMIGQFAGITSAHGDFWFCLMLTAIAWMCCDLWFTEKK